MDVSLVCCILCIFAITRLNIVAALIGSTNGTNITFWSEDDWHETEFFINTKFMFNRQRYQYVMLRSRMNEWSLELSYGNKSLINKLWTELHVYFNPYNRNTNFNNSLSDHIKHVCHPPIVSPLTNNSAVYIPQLTEIDKLVAKYFTDESYFRTINYLHCTITEKRQDPSIHFEFDVYFITNREFRSLLYIEMARLTRDLFLNNQARFYLHNNEQNFKYSFNISEINYQLYSNDKFVYMKKLYAPVKPSLNNVTIQGSNATMIVFIHCFILLFIRQF